MGQHGLCRAINRPAALRAMGNIFFTFPRLLTQAVLRAFCLFDQELHLIEISSLTPGDAYQAEFEFPG